MLSASAGAASKFALSASASVCLGNDSCRIFVSNLPR